MTTKPLVAATDGSEESLRAVEWAAREAVLHGAPLRIVAVAELLPLMHGPAAQAADLDTVADILRKNRDSALEAAAKRAVAISPHLVIGTDALSGPVAQAVTDSGSGALMLVVGSRGTGAFAAIILGSVSRYAATHASCPVAVIRDETAAASRRIVVGIRDADSCQDAVAFAFEEASLRQAALTAVHAWHGPASGAAHDAAARQLAELLASWEAKYPGVKLSQEVIHGHPGRVLAGMSAHADLTVLGGHSVLNHSHGPFITIPAASRRP
jgi:nucleotide-binding universal stress UspA family protein